MKYQQATDFEKQLIKLYYCQGIGLQGCWKIIWHWLETKEMNCSLEEMIAMGAIDRRTHRTKDGRTKLPHFLLGGVSDAFTTNRGPAIDAFL